MARSLSAIILLLLIPLVAASDSIIVAPSITTLPKVDKDLIEFALNLEYLEAEFFSYGSMGKGLDEIQPNLSGGGPKPMGVRIAKLSPYIRNIMAQFAYQEVGHIRKIKSVVPGFPRPLLNLTVTTFTEAANKAFGGKPLFRIFDPYANEINYLLSAYMIPYIGLTGLVGANAKLQTSTSKALLGSLLGVEAGQDAVIRTLLYERATAKVIPYGMTVAGNLLVGDQDSLAYGRTPEEILRIVYGTANEHVAGGFYPKGLHGSIAKKYLKSTKGLDD